MDWQIQRFGGSRGGRGGVWGRPGGVWVPHGCLLEPLGGVLGRLGGPPGATWGRLRASWGRLRGLLAAAWGPVGGILGRLWVVLARLGDVLAHRRKMYKNLRKIHILGTQGGLLASLGEHPQAFWGRPEVRFRVSWGFWGRLGPSRVSFGASAGGFGLGRVFPCCSGMGGLAYRRAIPGGGGGFWGGFPV